MASIAELLEELKRHRDELERDRASESEDLAAAARALGDHQAALDSLSAQQQVIDADVEATAKLDGEVNAAKQAIADVRKSGGGELAKAHEEYESLKSRVEQELLESRRTALVQRIEQIDTAIATATTAAETAGEELATAETALQEAKEAATAATKEHDERLQWLQALPQGVEAARAKVEALRAAAAGAVDAGRMAEAFVRARDLDIAIGRLEQALDGVADENLPSDIPELWQAKLAKSEGLATALAKVEPLRVAAAAARQTRDTLVADRDQKILEIVNEPPPVQPAPGAPDAQEAPK